MTKWGWVFFCATVACTAGCRNDATPTVDLSGPVFDFAFPTDDASNTTDIAMAGADLSLVVVGSPNPVVGGATITYTLSVTNAGPAQAEDVSVVSELPTGSAFVSATGTDWTCSDAGNTVVCSRPFLTVGAAPAITLSIAAPSTMGTTTFSAGVSSSTADPSTANNTVSVDTLVNVPADLSIALTASSTSVPVGSSLGYTLAVTNLGPNAATGVVVTDQLPAGSTFVSASGTGWTCAQSNSVVTCTVDSLAVGAAPAITVATTAPTTASTFMDQATLSASTADPDATNNTASAMVTTIASADLSIAASVTPDPVRIGSNFAYTISVTNHGLSTATNLTVSDTLPNDATFVSAAGSQWTCSNQGNEVSCTLSSLDANATASALTLVATAPANAETLSNTATVAAQTSDPDSSNNSVTTTSAANLFADVGVTIADSPDPVQGTTSPGCSNNDCTTYTTTVSNAGPDAATGISVAFQLPANGTFFNAVGSGWICPAPSASALTCTRAASLAAGATAPNITIVWKAPSPGGFSIVLKATVSSTSTDPSTANNTATEATTVLP